MRRKMDEEIEWQLGWWIGGCLIGWMVRLKSICSTATFVSMATTSIRFSILMPKTPSS